jgi:sec-independent protein translocase protein TatA
MRIGPFGPWEIVIILLVILIVFGARRLPDMAKGIGQSVRVFRQEMRGLKEDAQAAPQKEPEPQRNGSSQS